LDPVSPAVKREVAFLRAQGRFDPQGFAEDVPDRRRTGQNEIPVDDSLTRFEKIEGTNRDMRTQR
jgi:hypothetical protein